MSVNLWLNLVLFKSQNKISRLDGTKRRKLKREWKKHREISKCRIVDLENEKIDIYDKMP